MDGKILIVDDVATNRILLKARLASAHYCPTLASSGAEAWDRLHKARFDLVLLDIDLPDVSGIDVLRQMRADPALHDLPVIVLTATLRAEKRLAALAAGADDVFPKPCDTQLLLARIRNLLRDRHRLGDLGEGIGGDVLGLAEAPAGFDRQGVIALVSPRPESGRHLRRALQPHLGERLLSLTPDQAIGDGTMPPPPADIFVIEAAPAFVDGGRGLLSDLLSRATTRQAGVCLIAAEGMRAEDAAMAFDLGASDIIAPGSAPQETALRLRAALRRKRQADRWLSSVQDGLRHAVRDPVTGLHNRRFGLARLQALLRQPEPLALLMADLDRFKSVNDRFGHAAGDHVLVEVARCLSAALDPGDVLARYGGEEFLILLPGRSAAEARAKAEALCATLAATPIALPGPAATGAGGGAITVTASFGLALTEEGAETDPGLAAQALLARADRALMRAKAQGRNIVIAEARSIA